MTRSAAARSVSRPGGQPVVLLVEDHHDTRQMYAEFLGGAFQIHEAADAAQAMATLSEVRPDVVITDLSLPDMDGFELVARIRRDPAVRDVPVICLSGYGGHAHEQRAREVGCDRVIQKPCLPDALSGAIMELLRLGGAQAV
jgi:CheY-like chemotaxis protein